ncbi:MAG: hypothetical protein N2Z72_04745 [Bacteroidales bacterium]|nr:hypothetical protein [Bacteroidales bacterium]
MKNNVFMNNEKEVKISLEILTPIVSTRLASGETISSFVGKKIDDVLDKKIVFGEVYSIMAWNAMAELLRKKYKKGMLVNMKGILSYVKIKFNCNYVCRKTLIVTQII